MVSTTNRFNLIIECYDTLNKKDITVDDLLSYFKNNEDIIEYYSMICHDQDVDENGVLKRKHLHIILVTYRDKSCKTVINDIAKTLMINKNCISCKGVVDFIKSVQYLIHLNNREKYQYSLEGIYTNNKNDLYNTIYNSCSEFEFDFNYLLDLVSKSSTLQDIYKEIGLKKVKSYRAIIIDLWRDKIRLN